jgi:ribonucleoside-diphosphate reductase alpha chain
VEQSVATTCIKPSGTVSQLVGVAGSGLHPSYSKHYIRRVRQDIKDPLNEALISAGQPFIPDPYNKDALVFEFPMKAPAKSITKDKVSALEHLEVWKKFSVHWCEHKPSVTIYIEEDEWLAVGAWCWENFDILSGVSFLPKADDAHIYEAAPYEEISSEEYAEMIKKSNLAINWDAVVEESDNTTGSQELACTAGACEI